MTGMKLCEHIDSLHGFVEALVGNLVLPFIEGETKTAFINASFIEIKNRFLPPSIPPPGCMGSVPNVLKPIDEYGEFVCIDRQADGSFCKRTLSTRKKQFATHRMTSVKLGGDHCVLSLGGLAVTTRCTFCRASLTSRNAAQKHVRNVLPS